MCSASGYYAWLNRSPSARQRADRALRDQIVDIHSRSRGTYGVPRIHAELAAEGVAVGRKRVARLMRQAGIQGVHRRRKVSTTRQNPERAAAPDLVRREFTASGPDHIWVADIERHEAFVNRAVVGGRRLVFVAVGTVKLRAARTPGTGVRVGSSPEGDGTDQYCQMVRVRLARQKGVREEPATEGSSRQPSGSNLADRGRAATHTHTAMCVCVW